jgi:N-acetylglucosaminyldiphosphoundecaprenol N-acetyl-beta-D-mannosaminyltransferase
MHQPDGPFTPTSSTAHDALPGASPNANGLKPPLIPAKRRKLPTQRLMSMDIHAITEQQTIDFVIEELAAGRGGVLVTPNLDHLRRFTSRSHLNFRSLVAEADLLVPDGMPLIWASRIKGTPLPERVAGSDLILSLSKAAQQNNRSVYLLGGAAGTAEGAAEILRQRYPGIRIAGLYCPPFGFEHKPQEMAKIIQQVEQANPDIVYVALGSPKQEELIDKVKAHLPRAWWIGVGVSFSFLTGAVQRAPAWMQKSGIEWAHRMVMEPGKLLKRYLLEGIPFAFVLFGHSAAHRVLRSCGFVTDPVNSAPRDSSPSGFQEPAFVPGGANPKVTKELAAGNVSVSSVPFGIDDTSPEATTFLNVPQLNATSSGRSNMLGSAMAALPRIKSMVLLGGQIRANSFADAIGRPVLDLPVNESNETLLNHWLREIGNLAKYAGIDRLEAQLLLSEGQARPVSQTVVDNVGFAIKDDKGTYRGTGGVLHDLCTNYNDDDWILVGNAAQLLMEPLAVLAAALAHKRADVSLLNHVDGTPSGLMLIRCAALRLIKPVGYIDMKEQALPQIAKQFDVKVVHCRRATGLSIRSAPDYIAAVRQLSRGGRKDRRLLVDPFVEDFNRSFAIVEPGAAVDPDAYLHDAVVLKGARVESGAAVIRSVLAANANIRRDERVIDQTVSGQSPWHSSSPAFGRVQENGTARAISA